MAEPKPITTILRDGEVAELEVRYRNPVPSRNRITVRSPDNAQEVFRRLWNTDTIELRETFKVMLLNRSNQVLGIVTIGKGGICATVVDVRLLFSIALKSMATSIILAHNHPSGQLKFSEQDRTLTEKIIKASELLDITVLDHLLLTSEGYASYVDDLFEPTYLSPKKPTSNGTKS